MRNGGKVNGMVSVDLANAEKKVFEHAGHDADSKKPEYDLVVSLPNVGATGTGTIVVKVWLLQA